jgi:Mg-chelatase subunit ChlD
VGEAARAFIELMDFTPNASGGHDRVAIVGFNDRAWAETALATDSEALARAIDGLEQRVAQGTRLDLALVEGGEALQSSSREPDVTPVLILLTDGMPNHVPTPHPSGSQEDTVLAAAAELRARGVRIYTIGVGDPDSADPAGRIHPGLLRAVATDAGMYFETPDAEDLVRIYSEIAYAIGCPAEQFWGRR